MRGLALALLLAACGGRVEADPVTSCFPYGLCLLPGDAGTGMCDPTGSACVDRNFWPLPDAGETCFPALTDCASDGGCKQGRVCVPAGAVRP